MRAKLMRAEAEAAKQVHDAQALADEAELEKIVLKKNVQDLTRKLESAQVTTRDATALAKNRELATEITSLIRHSKNTKPWKTN